MLRFRLYTLLLLSVLTFETHARLFIDISIINKKGIDKGLTLGSELHSVEEVSLDGPISLKMRSGIQVEIMARFVKYDEMKEQNESYGPHSKIRVTGRILDSAGAVMKDFSEAPLFIGLEDTSKVIHSKDSQLVEVSLRPHLK